MKKIIIFSLMLISALSVDAQRKRTRTATSQGNVVVRFGMGLNSTKWDPDLDPITKSTNFHFSPSVGYMVIDNLELGVDFGVDYMTEDDIQTQSPLGKTITDMTDVNFGVYAYKYFPLNNWFAFTTSAHLGMSTGTVSVTDIAGATSTTNKALSGSTNGVYGAIRAGFGFTPYNAFMVHANFATLGVETKKWDGDLSNDTVNYTDGGLNVLKGANLSIVWFFGRGLWKK
jgi:hypothetical protein